MTRPELPTLSHESAAEKGRASAPIHAPAGVEDEAAFREDYEESARGPRLILLGMGAALIAVTPFYDRFLLHIPEAFVGISRLLQFGLQIPPILLALWCTWHPPLRRWSAPATVLAMLLTGIGLSLQHVLGHSYDFHVPHEFVALTVAAVCMLGRLRLKVLMPWAGLLILASSATQLYGLDFSSAAFYNVISIWMLFLLAVTSAHLLESSARENWRQRRLLEMQAALDALTSLPNRRHFDRTLVQLLRQAARERKNVALMLLDVDHFKAYNDHYGHPAGDECLRQIARWLAVSMRRPQDFCARIGGEEFAAVWFDARMDAAPVLAAKLRAGITALGIEHAGAGKRRVVSASAGFIQIVSSGAEDAATALAADMVDQADRALYEAKRAGRDRLVEVGHSIARAQGPVLGPMI